MTEYLAALTWRGRTQCDNGQCNLWETQRSGMTHESESTWKQAEYPIDWMKCRQVPCSKVTNNCHLLKMKCISLPLIFPSWLMSASFHFYEFKEGKKTLVIAHLKTSPTSYVLRTWERRGSFPKKGLSMFNLTIPMKENSVSFMFRESEWLRKKTPKGFFFIWFSL